MPMVPNMHPTNPREYYDHVAFSERRRSKNKYTSFDVNTFVERVVNYMSAKHEEYKKARVKSFTRFEEKCDFIDDVVFPAIHACSDDPTDENMKRMVDVFEKGVRRFTTFGRMSGIAEIFESAYFAMTDVNTVKEYDNSYCGVVEKQKTTVSAKSANFTMSDETKDVMDGEKPKQVAIIEKQCNSSEPVMGVVVDDQNARISVVTGVPADRVGFFNAMRSVRVPQHPVGVAASEDDETRALGEMRVPQHPVGVVVSQDGAASEVMNRTSCNA